MSANDIKKVAEDNVDNVIDKAKNVASTTGSEIAKSGKDWVNYIQNHPLQSILFGIISYFAIKGMLSD